jgi:hypothetical protein
MHVAQGESNDGAVLGDAITTTLFLLNHAPTKVLEGRTPYEACKGIKLVVGFLGTFGYLGFIKDKRPGLKKLDDQSAPMVFIRYSRGVKVYRLLDPVIEHIHTSHDVIFDESRGGIGT